MKAYKVFLCKLLRNGEPSKDFHPHILVFKEPFDVVIVTQSLWIWQSFLQLFTFSSKWRRLIESNYHVLPWHGFQDRFAPSALTSEMVPVEGLEPPTARLQGECSKPTELNRRNTHISL